MTSLTTIFGLLPLAMGISLDIISRDILVGSRIVDWWSNLAVSIVFGLGFSTFVTLILTPAILSLPYAIKNEDIIDTEYAIIVHIQLHKWHNIYYI